MGKDTHVSAGKLPHTGKKLDEPTNTDGHADNHVGSGNVASADIVEGEDEGGRGEGEQATIKGRSVRAAGERTAGGLQRSWVGELAVVDGESGLGGRDGLGELTSLDVAGTVGRLLSVRRHYCKVLLFECGVGRVYGCGERER